MRICESIFDEYAPELVSASSKLSKDSDSSSSEFAKSSAELKIPDSNLAFQMRLDVVLEADNNELKQLIVYSAKMLVNILDNSRFINERSKVFPLANFELEGFDNEILGVSNDTLAVTSSFSLTESAQPKDIAKLVITLLRNFIMLEDAHSNELSSVRLVLMYYSKKGNTSWQIDSIDEEKFEGQIDTGLNYEDEHAFYFMDSLMNIIHSFFNDFQRFDAKEWERQYVAEKYDDPFYIWLNSYLKREHLRWKR